jgi:hypothetical protein
MKKNLIALTTLCSQYEIEFSFVHALHKTGLIEIEMIEEDHFIHQDQISDLERMIRLHQDLNVNIEGIDVVINLLEKQRALREELTVLKNRLRLYE